MVFDSGNQPYSLELCSFINYYEYNIKTTHRPINQLLSHWYNFNKNKKVLNITN